MHQYTIKDLAQFMKFARDAERPYIFATGAGCSVTAGIPLARKIVEELNKLFSLELKSLSEEERKDYGKCMECIEVSKRRTYLKRYINEAKINWAHIALSCLIKEGYVRRILTFNFDNLLARSCGLLGLYPATYDFTAANLNLHSLIDDPAIVHLHGQGHGFVQLNTQLETGTHAKQLKEFITHTLNESPTLFIGYSGQNDAFLPQIQKQFTGQHRLFWVDMGKRAPEYLANSILESRLANYMSCENGADLFLVELAQELGCFPPTIFADPYQHLLNELDEIANYPMLKEDPSEDKNENRSIRSNTSTQDILLGTKNKLKEVQQRDKETETDFLQEYLQGNYEEIIEKLETQQPLVHEQSLWLARAYLSLALREPDQLEEVNLYEKLIERFKESDELDVQEQVAKAFLNKGVVLGTLEQPESAIKVYDELLGRFSEIDESGLQEVVAIALVNKGITLEKIKQSETAIKAYSELTAKFGERNEAGLQEPLAIAFNNTGYSKLLMAKKQWKDTAIAQDYLHGASKDFSKALTKSSRDNHALILGNLAYTEFLLGNKADSEIYLLKALQQGGKLIYDEAVKDITKHPIDVDTNFKDLLEKVWNEIDK